MFEQRARAGFVTAMAGLALALVSFAPAFRGQPIPVPLIAGSSVYLVGALFAAYNARGQSGKSLMVTLRYVRLGFVLIVLLLLFQTGQRG